MRAAASVSALSSLVLLTGCGVIGSLAESLRHPAKPFEQTPAPPAPDYPQPRAWMAVPGGNGLERSTPTLLTPIDESTAPRRRLLHPSDQLSEE